LEIYARALIERLAQSIRDKEKEFTGIPLQTQMLAEVYLKEVETFCLSHNSEPDSSRQLCLIDLYRKFIEHKYNIFNKKGEIAKEQDSNVLISDISVTKNHQKLTLEILFPQLEDTVTKLEDFKLLSSEEIARIGIVQFVDDKPHFIHRTFAEYYVADFLITQLIKKTNSLSEVQYSLLNKLLLAADYRVIRFFVDGLLLNPEPSEVNLKQYGKQIYSLWDLKPRKRVWKIKQNQLTRVEIETVVHQAAEDGNAHIIGFLFSSLKAAGHSDVINKLLLHKNSYRKTGWHVAAESGHIKTLETLWFWAREVQLNLKDDLLLAEDFCGQTAWHLAARYCRKEILEELWGWATEVQLNLKDDLLLAKDDGEQTAWHIAACHGYKEILEELWVWVREVQLNLKDDLLLAKDKYRQTAWHIAAKYGKKEILEELWGWAREVQLNLKDDLLLVKDMYGQTAWNIAVEYGEKEILEELWGWAREVQANLKDKLLLAKDKYGQTAWHTAAKYGEKEILQKLWGWAREVQLNLKDDLLLAKDTVSMDKLHGTEQQSMVRKIF
jgi:ankyrin repeat protein